MKALILAIALLFGVLFMTTPKEVKAEAEPCVTMVITCPDGTSHIAMVCGNYGGKIYNLYEWIDILCGDND